MGRPKKLTDDDALMMTLRAFKGEVVRTLAVEYGMSYTGAGFLINGRTRPEIRERALEIWARYFPDSPPGNGFDRQSNEWRDKQGRPHRQGRRPKNVQS